jgi:alkylated DNA repair dioxygenase AlkB
MNNPFDELHEQERHWTLSDEGIEITYDADFLVDVDADRQFAALKTEIPWRRFQMSTPDGPRAVPRMISWHADADLSYKYGVVTHAWQAWTPTLLEVRGLLEAKLGIYFNGVLANLYENERDSVSPHADDERDMVDGAAIASVSFGATREFVVRHMTNRNRYATHLEHGSLLVMSGDTQRVSRHSVPKAKRACGPRINLTYRIARGSG